MDEQKRTFRDKFPKAQMLASFVASTVTYAMGRGVKMKKITAATGITTTDLLDPEARLPQEVMPTLWRLLSKAYPGKALTLHMASAAPLSCFGTLAYGAQYAANFREALQVLIRYRFVLSEALHLALLESPSEAIFQMHHPMDAKDGGCAAEVGAALGSRFIKEVLGFEDILVRVDFTHKPFGPIEVYEDFFNTPVKFQQKCNALVFRKEALNLPNKQPDKHLFRYIEENMELMRKRLAIPNDAPELSQVHEAIAHNAERSEYGAEALAQQMNMSLRSLQRLISGHGTTVRELLEKAREANARQLLTEARLSTEEVSFLLGYSEDRAFRRAFKRWTGKTPAQFRRSFC